MRRRRAWSRTPVEVRQFPLILIQREATGVPWRQCRLRELSFAPKKIWFMSIRFSAVRRYCCYSKTPTEENGHALHQHYDAQSN